MCAFQSLLCLFLSLLLSSAPGAFVADIPFVLWLLARSFRLSSLLTSSLSHTHSSLIICCSPWATPAVDPLLVCNATVMSSFPDLRVILAPLQPIDFDGDTNLFHFALLRSVGKGAFGKVQKIRALVAVDFSVLWTKFQMRFTRSEWCNTSKQRSSMLSSTSTSRNALRCVQWPMLYKRGDYWKRYSFSCG
jgi:hypothetical protein